MNFHSPEIICSEMLNELMEDVLEKHVDEQDCEAAGQGKNNDKNNDRENMIEVKEKCDPFNDSDTQIMICTEITEDEVKDLNNDALGETSDQKLTSWFDLFKSAYTSWGRAEQDNSTAAENYTSVEELEDLFTDTECAIQSKPKMVVFHRPPIQVDNDSKVDTEEDDENAPTSAEAFVSSFVDYRDVDQYSETEEEDTERLCKTEIEVNNLSEIKMLMEEILWDIERSQHKQESETDEDHINEELSVMKIINENEKYSEIDMTEYQKLSGAKRDDKGEPDAGSEKVNSRVKKSARIAAQQFSILGSVAKIEKVEGVKLALRKSTRLEDARKRKTKEEGDEANKRQKEK